MTAYDVIVYDLDGTVVDLDVDWDVVQTDVLAVYEAAGVDPPSTDLWDLLEGAAAAGLAADVEDAIAAHEHEGARRSDRLARADELLERAVPVAVCSLNCETACRLALEEHGLDASVGAVVGRDTVSATKPDPEPLLEAVRLLSGTPATTLFVGDSERDELAAKRAGIDFEYVDDQLVDR